MTPYAGRNFSSGTRAIPTLVIAALIVTGGLTGASPAICLLPGPFIPQPSPPSQPSRSDLDRLIDRLGSFDLDVRTDAARSIRRAPGTVALPALLDAANGHADGFVRRRSLVLLSGYDDPRVPDQMEQAAAEANDGLRTIAFRYFERHPDPRLAAMLLRALPKETAEFARPALIRALAALGRDLKVQKALLAELARASDASRSDTIEALGDHKATYALKSLATLAKTEGPFQDRAALALCQLGTDCPGPDRRVGAVTADALAALATKRPEAIVALLSGADDQRAAIAALRDGLGRLADDFGEEQLFAHVRSAYFAEAEGSPTRELLQTLINTLEY